MEIDLIPKENNETLPVKQSQEVVTKEKIIEYLNAFNYTNLNEKETKQFIEIACAFQLNPFKKEIYCIPYNSNGKRTLSIITGYEVYLKRAERSNKLAGWDVKIEKENSEMKATIKIYRHDWKFPLIHEVWSSEYDQKNFIWKSKPRTMLKKVAIAQGFRLAFPDECGGMPYTSDELPTEMTGNQNESTNNIQNKTKDLSAENKKGMQAIIMELNSKIGTKEIFTNDERVKYMQEANEVADDLPKLRILYNMIKSQKDEIVNKNGG